MTFRRRGLRKCDDFSQTREKVQKTKKNIIIKTHTTKESIERSGSFHEGVVKPTNKCFSPDIGELSVREYTIIRTTLCTSENTYGD